MFILCVPTKLQSLVLVVYVAVCPDKEAPSVITN
jgi:hypothetical protein